MSQIYHILNGDALHQQFPDQLAGERIIFRECLVDGPLMGDTLSQFFHTRAVFIQDYYGDYTEQDYYQDSATEINKISKIPKGAEIHLWFEDDLFCQVNLWFTIHLLQQSLRDYTLFLVRLPKHGTFGFAGFHPTDLIGLYEQRLTIQKPDQWAKLWAYYQGEQLGVLHQMASKLAPTFPFLLPAVEAHLDRLPKDGQPGRPRRILKQIIEDLGTTDFIPVFREFNRREAIYGFGDLQVRRLWETL